MILKKIDLIYYTLIGILFLILKWTYTIADQNEVLFLVTPVNKIISILTGTTSVFNSESGYYFDHLNIIIGKSCSGYNFWLLCFILLAFLNGKHNTQTSKFIGIPVTLLLAYLITLFVNASRIFVSIIIQNKTNTYITNDIQHIIHESIGIITNLTFLIVIYYLVEKHIITFFITKKI